MAEKLKLAESEELMEWDSFAMRERSAEIEEELRRLAARVPAGRVLELKPAGVSYQALVTRVARMREGGRIDAEIRLIKRGQKIGLARRKSLDKEGKAA